MAGAADKGANNNTRVRRNSDAKKRDLSLSLSLLEEDTGRERDGGLGGLISEDAIPFPLGSSTTSLCHHTREGGVASGGFPDDIFAEDGIALDDSLGPIGGRYILLHSPAPLVRDTEFHPIEPAT